MFYVVLFVFFFKQKTAYEMRISDWSSDVCSSDLVRSGAERRRRIGNAARCRRQPCRYRCAWRHGVSDNHDVEGPTLLGGARLPQSNQRPDRKSVVQGKSVSVRVDLGGLRIRNKDKT